MKDFKPPAIGVTVQYPNGGRIEQEIGKRRIEWSVGDLVSVFRRLELKLLCLMHVGGDGQLHVVDFAPRDDEHLRSVLLFGERADGSSIFKGLGIDPKRSDIVLHPRIDTAFVEPFSEVPAMAVLCDHYGRNGLLLPVSPQTILRRAAERFREATGGAELWSLGEVEYFAGSVASASLQPHELRYHAWVEEGGYHAVEPSALFANLRRKTLSVLQDIGVAVKYAHGEVGLIPPSDETSGVTWEQHEIELALAPIDEAADALVLTQYVLANVAKQLHIAVSFAPMLLPGHAGSGLHQHVSVVRDDIHLPHVTDDGIMSDSTLWLVGGLLELGGALMCVGNRVEDSFLRLTQGKEAPRGVFWGYYNRGSMIRLPVQVIRRERGSSEFPVTPATVEYRLGDGSAFPHLLLAGIAQAATYATTIPRDTLLDRVIAGASSQSDAIAAVGIVAQRSSSAVQPSPVPLTMAQVAAELKRCQVHLCQGGVFPEETMHAISAALLEA